MINFDSNIILKYRDNGVGYYSMSDDNPLAELI